MEIRTANHAAAALLETKRCRLLRATGSLDKPCFERVENWSEPIDLAQAVAAHDTSEAVRHLLAEVQEDVDRALARLVNGSYGTCEDCSQPISLERLRALPEAAKCMRCQRDHNQYQPIRTFA